jgi:hypothetical protein
MIMRKIMVRRCAYRALQMVLIRWIGKYDNNSLLVVSYLHFKEYSYLEQLSDTCILHYFNAKILMTI